MHSDFLQSWNPLGAALQAYRAGREDAIIMVDNSVQENEELQQERDGATAGRRETINQD